MVKAIEEMPSFSQAIYHREILGSIEALAMNRDLLVEIAEQHPRVPLMTAMMNLHDWLDELAGGDKVTLLGKSIGHFDLQFLREAERQTGHTLPINRRVIDIDAFLATVEGHIPPLSKLLGSKTWVEHRALDDAKKALFHALIHWDFMGILE